MRRVFPTDRQSNRSHRRRVLLQHSAHRRHGLEERIFLTLARQDPFGNDPRARAEHGTVMAHTVLFGQSTLERAVYVRSEHTSAARSFLYVPCDGGTNDAVVQDAMDEHGQVQHTQSMFD